MAHWMRTRGSGRRPLQHATLLPPARRRRRIESTEMEGGINVADSEDEYETRSTVGPSVDKMASGRGRRGHDWSDTKKRAARVHEVAAESDSEAGKDDADDATVLVEGVSMTASTGPVRETAATSMAEVLQRMADEAKEREQVEKKRARDEDELEDTVKRLRTERDEWKRQSQTQMKTLKFLGCKGEDASDMERMRTLLALKTVADKEGGVDNLLVKVKRVTSLSKAHERLDYQRHVLLHPAVHVEPRQVVRVNWSTGATADFFSFATVCPDPHPDAPMEVHLELCMEPCAKQCMPVKHNVLLPINGKNAEAMLDSVFNLRNLRMLWCQSKHGHPLRDTEPVEKVMEAEAAFRTQLWRDSRKEILGKLSQRFSTIRELLDRYHRDLVRSHFATLPLVERAPSKKSIVAYIPKKGDRPASDDEASQGTSQDGDKSPEAPAAEVAEVAEAAATLATSLAGSQALQPPEEA